MGDCVEVKHKICHPCFPVGVDLNFYHNQRQLMGSTRVKLLLFMGFFWTFGCNIWIAPDGDTYIHSLQRGLLVIVGRELR